MRALVRLFAGTALAVSSLLLLAGCGAEQNNPIAVQAVGSPPPRFESALIDLDARGFINGVFQPDEKIAFAELAYPVRYTGDWKLIKVNSHDGHYMITSTTPGARMDLVASVSRAIIDFWDYEMYQNPGRVRFELDGAPVGSFNLAGATNATGKINDYQVATGKTDVATISLILESGRVVICGYVLVFPDTRFTK
ncbi:MAG TPA: hypothetical protein PLP29_19160 [Candidatus Ozemobacteraceae bacterium]|nr:hypothetical protein [Candidatus Ozemobacteraceae bacterium]